MQQPFVSVIIPAYNRRHLIKAAIEGVLSQTYGHYEIIVVDDASTDGTAAFVIEQYPQARMIRLEQNVGAAGARNVGIEAAGGELTAFLDSDDYWDSTYLEKMVRSLTSTPQANFVFSNHREILQDGVVKTFVYKESKEYQDLVHRSLADTFIYTMSVVVVRTKALKSIGLLDNRLSVSHDRELYIRLLQTGTMAHVKDSLVTRLMHEQNISTDYSRWAENVFLTLDIFFENPSNKKYLPLEPSVRSMRAVMFARHFWYIEKAPLISLLMILRAFRAAPILMFSKLRKKARLTLSYVK